KVEPTGALTVCALLEKPEMFANRSVCIVASGGHVDAEIYRGIIA
ncbi:MAG: hypothetical protein H7Z37_06490, partial [Pyrinomonadaceae bacterium]|nr:hypothetical protein [Pyrinomonadaceae bacterium]